MLWTVYWSHLLWDTGRKRQKELFWNDNLLLLSKSGSVHAAAHSLDWHVWKPFVVCWKICIANVQSRGQISSLNKMLSTVNAREHPVSSESRCGPAFVSSALPCSRCALLNSKDCEQNLKLAQLGRGDHKACLGVNRAKHDQVDKQNRAGRVKLDPPCLVP